MFLLSYPCPRDSRLVAVNPHPSKIAATSARVFSTLSGLVRQRRQRMVLLSSTSGPAIIVGVLASVIYVYPSCSVHANCAKRNLML